MNSNTLTDVPLLKQYDIATNGISLHVTEQGEVEQFFSATGFRKFLDLEAPDESHRVGRLSGNRPGYARLWPQLSALRTQTYTRHCKQPAIWLVVPRGDVSVFERMRTSGHQDDFYMFEQLRPEADQIWADAAVTIPGVLYWASGSAPADKRWNPFDPARSLYRRAPEPLPSWAEPDCVAHDVLEFQRTGFHGGLNYYRAAACSFGLHLERDR